MSTQTTPNNHPQCWCWSFGAGDKITEQLVIAYGAYTKRFGRVPCTLQVNPGLLADGLTAPVGMQVVANRHIPARALYFEVPDRADGLPF